MAVRYVGCLVFCDCFLDWLKKSLRSQQQLTRYPIEPALHLTCGNLRRLAVHDRHLIPNFERAQRRQDSLGCDLRAVALQLYLATTSLDEKTAKVTAAQTKQ